MKPEAWVLFDILKAWGSHPRVRLWRNNTGVANMNGRTVRFGIKGQADISGLVAPNGRRLEVECKTATGRQRPEQVAFQRMIVSLGGIYVLARCLEDFDRAMAEIGVGR